MVKTSDIEKLLQETVAYMNTIHPDYALLAGRLATYFIHKNTNPCYYSTCLKL